MQSTRALWTLAPGRAELRREALPEPGPGQILVETWYSAISRGTESLVFRGRVPQSEAQRMRAPHQAGDFPGPIKYGYANVGRVLSAGPLHGRMVFSLFPHQEHFVIAEEAVRLVPAGVPPARATLAANMETALNACWDARALPADRIGVIGAGVVGCLLTALLAKLPAVDLQLIDLNPALAPLAALLGAEFRSPELADGERDLLLHTSGNPAGLRRALELGRNGAKIVELSWYGDALVELALGAEFHSRRLQLASSQVGTVSPNKPGWSFTRRLDCALSLLSDARLDALMNEPLEFEHLPDLLPSLLGEQRLPLDLPGLCVRYPAAQIRST